MLWPPPAFLTGALAAHKAEVSYGAARGAFAAAEAAGAAAVAHDAACRAVDPHKAWQSNPYASAACALCTLCVSAWTASARLVPESGGDGGRWLRLQQQPAFLRALLIANAAAGGVAVHNCQIASNLALGPGD